MTTGILADVMGLNEIGKMARNILGAGTAPRLQDLADEELMLACKTGNDEALEELYRRYHRPLYAFACRTLGSSRGADDVVQEAFFRVFRARANYEPSARFSVWVYRIARNLCIDEKRRYWNRKVSAESQMYGADEGLPGPVELLTDNNCDARERMDQAADMQAVLDAIENLSPQQREVMVLSKFQGLSYAEIGDILDLPVESVKQCAYRAHLKLRDLLQPLLEEYAGSTEVQS